jgi:hypothetical protein
MRTSLTEIRDIELYLLDELHPQDALVFEARILTNPDLKTNVGLQRKLYELLKIFQRKRIKADVLAIHSKLFLTSEKKSFQDRVRRIFNQ